MNRIPDSKDWDTNTSDPMANAFREVMKSNFQKYANKPRLGIFWYDVYRNELFGVKDTPAEKEPFYDSRDFGRVKTIDTLHCEVWEKENRRGRDSRFSSEDWTNTPRGRVFEKEGEGFFVCVGSWINDYPQAKKEILIEFNLPDETIFKIDSHWELGHGWSDKL